MTTLGDFQLLAFAKGVDLNAIADTAIAIPNGGKYYVVNGVRTANGSVDLTASTATLGVYTDVAAGGTEVVATSTDNTQPLTAATKYFDCTLADTTDALKASTLYINVDAADGDPATCDVYIYGDLLT
jgi:hypothetical protein